MIAIADAGRNIAALKVRFERAAAAAGATRPSSGVFERLVDRYGEAHRHYHTLAHVDACLAWLDWFSALARNPAEVELALWFHDAIYDPKTTDNESRSAELARKELVGLGILPGAIDQIASHVEATAAHQATTMDAALVVDLDLSILGAFWRAFDRFEEQIRQEYAHIPEALFNASRCRVLEQFLSRAEIYHLPTIREELEARARANLARAIRGLC